MHDPMTVAFEIRRPWPQRTTFHGSAKKKRWSIRWSAFWTIAGVEYYWPGLITVWHVDPSGFDKDCPYSSKWRWHVHHWKLQVHPLQHFRRWALTRCGWCGGKSRKGDLVNHSIQWDREKTPWWKGETGLFHSDCSSIHSAHRQCSCEDGEGGPWEFELSGRAYGQCATCGKYRGWEKGKTPRDAANRLLQTIPSGQRDAEKLKEVSEMWAEHRQSQEAVDG